MKEKIFSLELKYHVDEFEYQMIKFIDSNGNVRDIKNKYLKLKNNYRLEDVIMQINFVNFLKNNCGVMSYSSVDCIELNSNDDIVYINYMKNTGYDQ